MRNEVNSSTMQVFAAENARELERGNGRDSE
jgi:hypothetical protein